MWIIILVKQIINFSFEVLNVKFCLISLVLHRHGFSLIIVC